jgi:hypothetical protein
MAKMPHLQMVFPIVKGSQGFLLSKQAAIVLSNKMLRTTTDLQLVVTQLVAT